MGSAATILRFDPLASEPEKRVSFGRRDFPTRQDYEAVARTSGIPAHLVWRNPVFTASVMRHWHQTGQTGCLFARHLARKIDSRQWPSLVLSGKGEGLTALVADVVPSVLANAIASEECEILSLLFPEVTEMHALRELCTALADETDITLEEDHSHSDWVAVALRLDITGAGQHSWIMAFGPYASWPPTRQAPVTELAIRVKPKPRELFHELNQDQEAAHLADTPLPVSEQQMEAIFERTGKATRNVLGADPDYRSAARTTFSYTA
jgi:hypothetical protein